MNNKGYFYYPDRVLRLNSYPDLLHPYFQKAGSPIKEMAECWGLYQFLTEVKEVKDKDTLVVIVGDGTTPRLGALLAVMTKWECISIDPALREIQNIERLTIITKGIEEIEDINTDKDLIVVFPHAHVNTSKAIKKVKSKKKRYIVVNPCCNPGTQLLKTIPIKEKEDKYMLTPHCRIVLYNG